MMLGSKQTAGLLDKLPLTVLLMGGTGMCAS